MSARPTASDWAELTGKPAPDGAEDDSPADPAPDVVRVWSGVWPIFELFTMAERVWRYPALGGPPIGLDWGQVRALADGYGVPWDRETLTLLQAAEVEAAGIWTAEWRRKNPPKGAR
ncbi:hypothetical protein VY88_26290 [Azospirillum thiophilum]|uniref:Uncharacterized protein n=1 Tax=Azospirillum thiophilum TaxID=528244 RepID=A0AAC8W4L7_9PROT|nr:DUF1799 domain-containing protein [Azospirillum thiophilum]ALG75049.1 hypothetical protein AL072_29200 [Azospirillum thiophilum]KJR62441.1 hypothetical protein VY88_26290 [Azospirillum thiophilum]